MLCYMSSCLTRKNNLLANADALKFNNVCCTHNIFEKDFA